MCGGGAVEFALALRSKVAYHVPMKRPLIISCVLAAGLLWLAITGAACGSSPNPLGQGGGTTTTTTTGTVTATMVCKAGGESCAAFSECCSDICANQLCT